MRTIQRTLQSLFGLLAILLLAQPTDALAVSVDFSTVGVCIGTDIDCSAPNAGGNRGFNLQFDSTGSRVTVGGELVITAKTSIPASPNHDPYLNGSTGTVFWGNLGGLDATPGNCTVSNMDMDTAGWCGLGVQNAAVDMNGNLDPSGSNGISGGGMDEDEALIFTFNKNGGVDADSVLLTLIGLTSGLTGMDADKNDIIELAFEFIPVEAGADSILTPVSFTGTSYTIDFSALGLPAGAKFGSFAVAATQGHFGVGGITYSTTPEVPEPSTWLLMCLGLAGLAAWRWKKQTRGTR